ncbi:MAG: hypothetical protein ABW067_19665, partial [Rhizobacter sp.]
MRDSSRSSLHPVLDGLKQGVVFGAAAVAVLLPPMGGARTTQPRLTAPAVVAQAAPREPRFADFGAETPHDD